MASSYPAPSRARQHGGTTLVYELSHRIHSTCIYPLQAPNGSDVVLYAQNGGISVVWRRGRALKPTKTSEAAAKPNGVPKIDDSIMIIDSDEEEPNTEAETMQVEYEDASNDASSEQPDRIVAHSFVTVAANPVHLSISPLSQSPTAHNVQYAPKYCADNIVVAAACADGSVRLLAIPIAPTHRQLQEPLENVLLYSGEHALIKPGGVSLSFATRDYANYNFESLTESSPAASRDEEWDMLVAWHVSDPVSAVSVAQIPIGTSRHKDGLGKPRQRTYYLPSPLVSLSFNPATRQLSRQKQLLLADNEGLVRVLELTFQAKTLASGTVQHELARAPNWAATFYIPFPASHSRSASPSAPTGRKAILGAEWAVDGRCIVVVLGDGTWGLWDLEGARPQTSGALMDASIYGGGVTHFTLRSKFSIKATSSTSVPERTEAARQPSLGDKRLAPMTPNTRKATQTTFLDKAPSRGVDTSKASRGGVSVSRLSEPVTSAPYETLLFWFDEAIFMIPNIMLYWQRAIQSASGGALAPSNVATVVGPSPVHLDELSTMGEAVTGVVQFPAYNDKALASHQRLQHDFVIAAEHRLIFFCPTKTQLGEGSGRGEFAAQPTSELGSGTDEQLLARGQLGLAGLDRLMDGMESSATNGDGFGQIERSRRVGFAARS